MYKVNLPKEKWAEQATVNGLYVVRVKLSESTDDQGNTLVIGVEKVVNHKPTKRDVTELAAEYLQSRKDAKKLEVEDYAKSDAVKAFEINGVRGWLDSEARVSIRRAVADKAAVGRESVTVYLAGVGFTMTPERAEEILAGVEVYASDCYDVTENHKAAVDALTDVAAVEAYDYATGYPEPLQFQL